MATVFKKVDYNLSKLIADIHIGVIGLPDIQRPFVWKNTDVQKLFDSMYRGYPVGSFLFLGNRIQAGDRAIGTNEKQKFPDLTILDGQQRLTSLYAVLKNEPVIRETYKKELIEIAFNPLDETFVVPDATTPKNPEFIPNISLLWHPDTNLFRFADQFILRLKESREVSESEENKIKDALNKLKALDNYPFTALELSADIIPEDAADIFVRINSSGKTLKTGDFILTLLSVFWDEGRADLETFCRLAREPGGDASPFNYHLQPEPDQLLRVSVGFGHRRARLNTVYSILRGKDLDTEQFSPERREQQFALLKRAQEGALNLTNWHEFLKALLRAGYLHKDVISGDTPILYAYVFFLIGKEDFGVDHRTLREVIAKYFFMISITSRYSGSFETRMEQDLALLREVKDAASFVALLNRLISERLTNDYFNITLPSELATSAPKSPTLFAYYASLVILNADVLFSRLKVSELLKLDISSTKKAVERHHLFPKAYLKKEQGLGLPKINQIANFALVEWPDNIDISDDPPTEYLPGLIKDVSAEDLKTMYYFHALPEGWESMEYETFLEKRRVLMAHVIRDAFAKLNQADEQEG